MSQATEMPTDGTSKTLRRFRYLALTASVMTFLLIVMGGIVRVTGSGLGCPDWPLCYGQIIPPPRMDAWLESLHRWIASLTSPFIIAAAVVAWLRFRKVRLILIPMMVALALLVVEIALGAVTVILETPPTIVAVHLGIALIILAMNLIATVTAFRRCQDDSTPDRLTLRSPFARLALWTLAGVFVVLISGAFVAGTGATAVCSGWPLCNGQLFPSNLLAWVHMIHRFIVAGVGLLALAAYVNSLRTQRSQTGILVWMTLAMVLFIAQAYIGALKTTRGFPMLMLGLHVASAAAVWLAMVVTVVSTGLAARSDAAERKEGLKVIDIYQRARDLVQMTRPVVTALLLITAFAGMVVGAGGMPEVGTVLWTMLAGGLAAGGAQAINQYMDRDIDKLMKRTSKRPIPAHRMTPGEGLAWGALLCAISVYLMVGFVNWLAALMTLAGIIYYVIIYTLALKRVSVQNIVVGGGAGALAPVVGYTAVTGRLDLVALFLFLVIFLWTPPHFWALALVRRSDYAQAGVPMMPVVRGEQYTYNRIMLYAVLLVAVTLLPGFLNWTGWVYLVLTGVLGGVLLGVVWRLWRQGGNKNAWTLYRVSSLYLAFLMVALMLDVFIRA